jgi:hypothetical protein
MHVLLHLRLAGYSLGVINIVDEADYVSEVFPMGRRDVSQKPSMRLCNANHRKNASFAEF